MNVNDEPWKIQASSDKMEGLLPSSGTVLNLTQSNNV